MGQEAPREGRVLFGTAGNSRSFYASGCKTSLEAPSFLRKRGLDVYELAFGRGIWLQEKDHAAFRAEAEKNHVTLSVHAPYFINLANPDREKILRSFGYLLGAVRAADGIGAAEVVVHVGSGMRQERGEALRHVRENLSEALTRMAEEGLSGVALCPETMGKPGQIGDLEEILSLCEGDERLLPCVDFAHLHALSRGGLDSREAFARVLDTLERRLGKERAQRTHMHFSAIQYGGAGEIRHLTFGEAGGGPRFELLSPELAERGFRGLLICECAGTQAEDAKAMQDRYEADLARIRAGNLMERTKQHAGRQEDGTPGAETAADPGGSTSPDL